MAEPPAFVGLGERFRTMKSAAREQIFHVLARAGAFAALWWLLTGGDPQSWVVGGPVVLAVAAGAHRRVARSPPWRLAGVPAMMWFFLRESVRGGFDVARRALRPRLPLEPGVVRFTTRLADGSPRLVFAGLISLLPGTLVLGLNGNVLHVHVLDAGPRAEAGLRTLEDRVGALFKPAAGAVGEVLP